MSQPWRNEKDRDAAEKAQRIASLVLGAKRAAAASIDQVTPGLSGASVFRLTEPSGKRYAIKGWPSAVSAQRVQEVHHVMNAARVAGCTIVPELARSLSNSASCIVDEGGRCWDICQWMDGRPCHVEPMSDETHQSLLSHVHAGGIAIARFHNAVVGLASAHRPAPAILQRAERWQFLNRHLPLVLREGDWDGFANRYRDLPELLRTAHHARQHLSDHWHNATLASNASMNDWLSRPVELQFVLRDVHRDHVLFADTSLSNHQAIVKGLIDFDAVRLDTPATDLARWAASFTTDATKTPNFRELISTAAAGYRIVRAFSEHQESLADTIAQSSAWITLANWLVWLVGEQKHFPGGPEAVLDRMHKALTQVQTVGRSRRKLG